MPQLRGAPGTAGVCSVSDSRASPGGRVASGTCLDPPHHCRSGRCFSSVHGDRRFVRRAFHCRDPPQCCPVLRPVVANDLGDPGPRSQRLAGSSVSSLDAGIHDARGRVPTRANLAAASLICRPLAHQGLLPGARAGACRHCRDPWQTPRLRHVRRHRCGVRLPLSISATGFCTTRSPARRRNAPELPRPEFCTRHSPLTGRQLSHQRARRALDRQ